VNAALVRVGTQGKLYAADWHATFTEDLKAGRASLERAHNVVVQSSRTAGANISHFPNYHISRCHELCDADRSRSASSQDDGNWVLQQLAGMTPLSTKVCRRMMGVHELPTKLVSRARSCSSRTTHIRRNPLLSPTRDNMGQTAWTDNNHRNNYDGHGDITMGPMQPFAANQFKTNLMLSIMAHFHPSPYVREESATYTFVPEHVQTMVMLAFADAIEKNVTQSEMLEHALGELFTETSTHVPFCSETASLKFTMTARSSLDAQHYVQRLSQAVPWDDVPLVHAEAGAPNGEVADQRRERRLANFEWDPYRNIYSAASSTAFERETGSREFLGEMHPMRSFSPASIAQAAPPPGARRAPAPAARIHADLGSAAARAAAFCRATGRASTSTCCWCGWRASSRRARASSTTAAA